MTFADCGKRIDNYLSWGGYFLDVINSYGCKIGLHRYVPFVTGAGYDGRGCFHPAKSMGNRCLFCYRKESGG